MAAQEIEQGPDHPRLAFILSGLGKSYVLQGRYSTAERAYMRCWAIAEQHWSNLNNRAIMHSEFALQQVCVGNYGKAERLCQNVLDLRTSVSKAPELDHDLAKAANALGVVLLFQRRPDDALLRFDQALAIWDKTGYASWARKTLQRTGGPDHKSQCKALHNKAVAYFIQARGIATYDAMQEAQSVVGHSLRSLAYHHLCYGDDSDLNLPVLAILAGSFELVGRGDDARSVRAAADVLLRSALGNSPSHSSGIRRTASEII